VSLQPITRRVQEAARSVPKIKAAKLSRKAPARNEFDDRKNCKR